jgi:hypothetical protein
LGRIAEIIARGYVDLKIDTDRMTQGKEVIPRYRPDPSGGIPRMAVLGTKGNVLTASDGPMGNIGYPAEPVDIERHSTFECEQPEVICRVVRNSKKHKGKTTDRDQDPNPCRIHVRSEHVGRHFGTTQ